MSTRVAYLAQRLMGPMSNKPGATPPDMSGSIVVYADSEVEARALAETMLPQSDFPGWLRIQETMSAIPEDRELREIAIEQAQAEAKIESGTDESYYVG